MAEQGRVVAVVEVPNGDALASDVIAGATLLSLYDTTDFSETGGQLDLNGTILTYTAKDDDAATVTLSAPLAAGASADDPVYQYPYGTTKVAKVQLMDNNEAIDAVVPTALHDILDDSIRDGDAEQESVEVEYDGADWYITTLVGETPAVLGEYIDPTTVPQPADIPVTAVGTPEIIGGINSLFVTWDPANGTNVTIQVHINTVDFVPVKDDPTTLVREAEGTGIVISTMPDGSPLVKNTPYYIALLAYNAGGQVVTPTAAGTLHLVDTPDISVDAAWVGTMDADRITAGAGLFANIDVVGSLIAHGSAGESVGLSGSGFQVIGPDSLGNPVYVDFPTDSASPNIISGTLIADTLEVNQGTTFHQSVQMTPGANVVLQSNTSTPQSIPGLSKTHPITTLADSSLQFRIGAVWNSAASQFIVGYSPAGSGSALVGKVVFNVYSSAWALVSSVTITPPVPSPNGAYWSKSARPYGMTLLGTTLYVVWEAQPDGATTFSAYRYITKHDINNAFATISNTFVNSVSGNSGNTVGNGWTGPPDLSNDGTNLLMFEIKMANSSDYKPWMRTLTPSTLAQTAAVDTGLTYSKGFQSPPAFIAVDRGTYDLGATRYLMHIVWQDGTEYSRIYDSTWTRQLNEEFPRAYNAANLTGSRLVWDGTRFWGIPYSIYQNPGAVKYSTSTWTTPSSLWWVGTTYYDSTGPYETSMGPAASINMDRRAFLKITVAANPTFQNRVYLGRGATQPVVPTGFTYQTVIASGAITATIDGATWTGVNPGTTMAAFPVINPGSLTSVTTDTATVTVSTQSTSRTVTATTGTFKPWYVGRKVTGAGVPANTTITSIGTLGANAVLSNAATATATGVVLTITQPLLEARGDGFVRIAAPVFSKAILTATQDVNASGGNEPPLRIGDIYGAHLRVDGDEIQAMAGDATPATLTLNQNGGAVRIGPGSPIKNIRLGRTTVNVGSTEFRHTNTIAQVGFSAALPIVYAFATCVTNNYNFYATADVNPTDPGSVDIQVTQRDGATGAASVVVNYICIA